MRSRRSRKNPLSPTTEAILGGGVLVAVVAGIGYLLYKSGQSSATATAPATPAAATVSLQLPASNGGVVYDPNLGGGGLVAAPSFRHHFPHHHHHG